MVNVYPKVFPYYTCSLQFHWRILNWMYIVTATNIINGCLVGYRTTKLFHYYCCDNCQRVSRLLGYTNSFDFIELIPSHFTAPVLVWCLIKRCHVCNHLIIRKIDLKSICQSNNFINSDKIMKNKPILTKSMDNNTQPMRLHLYTPTLQCVVSSSQVAYCRVTVNRYLNFTLQRTTHILSLY